MSVGVRTTRLGPDDRIPQGSQDIVKTPDHNPPVLKDTLRVCSTRLYMWRFGKGALNHIPKEKRVNEIQNYGARVKGKTCLGLEGVRALTCQGANIS